MAPAAAADERLTVFRVEHIEGKAITYDPAVLCKKLGVDDPGRLVVETQGHHGLVMVYPRNPLAEVRAVTREDLVMDRHGRFTTGLYHNGQPVRKRLYDPSTGSAQRFALFGTTGAGKSRALQLQLIAEKVNRICTWLADLKEGQSVPEAAGNVDWRATSQEAAILMLMAAVKVAEARMRRYSAMGRNSFVLGTDPLLHVWIDEANRLLERGAPYRNLATHLIKELGRTGRSVGVGIGLAAQASHLEELGGSDTLRAMIKEGEVVLLRWSASMMRQLVSDGILPGGTQLVPIPKTMVPTALRSPFDVGQDDDDVPGTQGMAYYLSGQRPTAIMRHLRLGSIAPLEGLDPEILALYGDEEPRRLEEISHEAAGAAFYLRGDPAAFEAMCDEFREAYEQKQKTSGGQSAAPAETGEDSESAPKQEGKVRIADRILAALAGGEAMTADDILAVVNADGGRTVKLPSLQNTLGVLVNRGDVDRTGRGLYVLTRG